MPAGYDYDAKLRIASAGLSPASTAASLAAPAQLASAFGLGGWRQSRHLRRQVKRLFDKIRNSRRQRRHPAVESAIHNLECRGLDRVRAHGRDGFARTVALAILAANLHRIGLVLQRTERDKIQNQRRQGIRRAA